MNLFTTESLVSFLSLAAMEIILGIDNIVFIAILAQRLPVNQQDKIRKIGLSLALGIRIGLLLALSWIMGLTAPLFSVMGHAISGRDIVLLVGGLFLMGKSSHEIYEKVEGDDSHPDGQRTHASFASVLVQILLLDIVFSLDSVITAVGMVKQVPIMIAAMVAAVIVMLIFAKSISEFIERHPSMKILALSFLLLIGVLLMAEGTGQHVQKGYIYFAMAFAVTIEVLNMRFRKKRSAPVPATSE